MIGGWVSPSLLQASFDHSHAHSKAQRKSLPLLDTAPKTTTLYVTYTAELRSDQDIYMLGIDKSYNSLEQANARVETLARCNFNPRRVETKLVHTDAETGCLCETWGKFKSQVRFVAQTKKVEMVGEVAAKDNECISPGAWDKDDVGLFFADMQLDIAGHVWVVAIHKPGMSMTEDGLRRHRSLSKGRYSSMSVRSSVNAAKLLNTIEKEKEEYSDGLLGWSIDSVHADSVQALNRAKRAWNEHFRDQGRCRKLREHYGFARYAFKPTSIGKFDGDYETCLQIRIERVRVVPESEMLPELLAAQVAEKRRSFHPFMPPLKNDRKVGRAFEGQLVSTINGQRSSFVAGLQRIADEMLQDSYDYDDLPLALKIRQEHMLRWGGLTDQRYGQDTLREVDENGAKDLYHAMLQDVNALRLAKRKEGGKEHTQAFVRARKRMVAALNDAHAANGRVKADEAGTTTTTTSSESPARGLATDGLDAATIEAISVAQGEKGQVFCTSPEQSLGRPTTPRKRAAVSAKDSVTGKEELVTVKELVKGKFF